MGRRFERLGREQVKKLGSGQRLMEGGIAVERLVDGAVRWSVNIMVSGRRIHRVIGRDDEGVSRETCETFIERARTEERDGRLNLPPGRKTHLTFAEVAERYVARLEAGGGKNLSAKRYQLDNRLIPYFGARPAKGLTEFTVNAYRKKRLEAGAAPGTVNRDLATLKHLFRDAVKAKDLSSLPCTFSLGKEPEGRVHILSEIDAVALMNAAVADQDPDLWLFVAFGLNTSMRHQEILKARFDQIDWTLRRLEIPDAKAGKRQQPLTAALVATLRAERELREDRQGYIFHPAPGCQSKCGRRPSMAEPFRRAAKRAGLDVRLVTPHTMRHTAITRLVQAGVDLPTIQRISGHKTLAMVLRYTHIAGAHIDRAMEALENQTGNLIPLRRNATST